MSSQAPGLDVLNVSSGHLKFRFDKSKPDETEKAKKVITDMLKRGYMIFVLVDGEQKRVREFDAEKEEYILEEPEIIPEPEPTPQIRTDAGDTPRRGPGRPRGRKVAMSAARATGIGPSAGG